MVLFQKYSGNISDLLNRVYSFNVKTVRQEVERMLFRLVKMFIMIELPYIRSLAWALHIQFKQ